ncbi:hypothetical protein V8E51_016538 [Hyaloscypha variabilis]
MLDGGGPTIIDYLSVSIDFGDNDSYRLSFGDNLSEPSLVDNGDTFATHCVGGVLGTVTTGLFARKEVAAYDGVTIINGGVFFDGNVKQLGIQLLEALIGFTWSFVGSYILFALVDCVPGLEVLAKDEDVVSGMDAAEMEESFDGQFEDDYHPFKDGAIGLE